MKGERATARCIRRGKEKVAGSGIAGRDLGRPNARGVRRRKEVANSEGAGPHPLHIQCPENQSEAREVSGEPRDYPEALA